MQEVVSVQDDHERLLHIQKVIKELPTAHFRWTLNFFFTNFKGCDSRPADKLFTVFD